MNNLSGRRILVTQAKDFMGPALCATLAQFGAEVIADERLLTAPQEAQALIDAASCFVGQVFSMSGGWAVR
jgi:2-keto-3-deoxy-L-fuconate dehydrogenase